MWLYTKGMILLPLWEKVPKADEGQKKSQLHAKNSPKKVKRHGYV
jgi:hypothetical protein